MRNKPTQPQFSTWLNIKEASDYLRTSTRSIRRAMNKGHLRRDKVGGRYLFHKNWLDSFACGFGPRLSASQMNRIGLTPHNIR